MKTKTVLYILVILSLVASLAPLPAAGQAPPVATEAVGEPAPGAPRAPRPDDAGLPVPPQRWNEPAHQGTALCNVLLVDDDWDFGTPNGGGRPFYTTTLDLLGVNYDIWDTVSMGTPSFSDMAPYQAVVWFTGYDWQTPVTAEEEAALIAYLDDGGNVFLSNQEQFYAFYMTPLMSDYFWVDSYEEDVILRGVVGNPADPLFAGLGPYDMGRPDEFGVYWPEPPQEGPYDDEVWVKAGGTEPMLYTTGGNPNGTRFEGAGFRTVYLAYPLEWLTDVEARAAVLGAALDWFCEAGPAEPDISVSPTSLSAEQCPDEVTTQTLWVCNDGGADLIWTLEEAAPKTLAGSMPFVPVKVDGGGANPELTASSPARAPGPVAPAANPEAVLWDQPLSTVNQNAYVSQEFPDYPTYSSFLFDDFVNAEPWAISTIFIPGGLWNCGSNCTLLNAVGLVWQVYHDNGGVPDGDPAGGGNPPAWSVTLAPTNPQVTISNGSYGYPSDITLTLAQPLTLPPGHWWLLFYPAMPYGVGGQYGRQPADTANGYWTQFINPGGGFGYGTGWQPWSVIGADRQDMAFRLESGPPSGDIPWLSEDPTSGTVPPGECAEVTVTFDSTGMAPGDYYAGLVIDSNDPDEPTVTVPVQMTVQDCAAVPLFIGKNKMLKLPSAPGVVKVTSQWRVVDGNGAPVPGAVMAGEWTLPDLSVVPGVPAYGATDALGREKFRLMVTPSQSGLYAFCVTGITAAGYWWDPGDPLACVSIPVP